MRILLVTETVPYPLDSGGRIKTYHTLRALSAAHEVHCHAFVREAGQLAHARVLDAICASVSLHMEPRSLAREVLHAGRSVIRRLPLSVERHVSRAVHASIGAHHDAVGFDIVYCDHLSMLEYGRPLGVPIVHDAHNVEYRVMQRLAATSGWGPRRLLLEREWRLVRAYERRAYRECALIFAVSDEDAGEIRTLAGPRVPIEAVPIGVDVDAVSRRREVRGRDLLFVGGLHWPPNADAAAYLVREIWPRVRQTYPDARLTIVGGRAPAHVDRDLQADGVELAGHVPDVEPYFARSGALAVPLRSGSGMRVKILDAFARGVPVVATTLGAEGIEAVPGRHYLRADDAATFAAHVCEMLGSPDAGQDLAGRALELVRERYDVAIIGARQRELVGALAGPFTVPTECDIQ